MFRIVWTRDLVSRLFEAQRALSHYTPQHGWLIYDGSN